MKDGLIRIARSIMTEIANAVVEARPNCSLKLETRSAFVRRDLTDDRHLIMQLRLENYSQFAEIHSYVSLNDTYLTAVANRDRAELNGIYDHIAFVANGVGPILGGIESEKIIVHTTVPNATDVWRSECARLLDAWDYFGKRVESRGLLDEALEGPDRDRLCGQLEMQLRARLALGQHFRRARDSINELRDHYHKRVQGLEFGAVLEQWYIARVDAACDSFINRSM